MKHESDTVEEVEEWVKDRRKDNEECDDEDEIEVEVGDEMAILRLMRAVGE